MNWRLRVRFLDGDCLIGTGTGLLIAGLAGGAGSAVSGILGANAASSASKTQAQASEQASQLELQAEEQALQQQQGQFSLINTETLPWRTVGTEAEFQLENELGVGGSPSQAGYGSLTQGFNQPVPQFDPNATQIDPGFNYRLQVANQALQASAAAKGTLNSGGTEMALLNQSQNLASQEYQNAYARNLQNYQSQLQSYGAAQNTFYNNQANQYNRLAGLAGAGQQTVGSLASLGQNNANSISSLLTGTAGQIAQNTQAGAAATAAGTVGSTNAFTGALAGFANQLQGLAFLNQLNNGKPQGLTPGYAQPPGQNSNSYAAND